MKARTRKLLSLLLALCMLTALFPVMTVTAAALEAGKVDSILVGDEELDEDYRYLVNGKAAGSGTLGKNGCTAEFDYNNRTLTIQNYNGGGISACMNSDPQASWTLVVTGDNTINAGEEDGISSEYANLIIQGADDGRKENSLTIHTERYGIDVDMGNLTIQDLKSVDIYSSSTYGGAVWNMGDESGGIVTISNIGTFRASCPNIYGSHDCISVGGSKLSISQVDTLEIFSKGWGITCYRGYQYYYPIDVTECGVVSIYSKEGTALNNYCGGVNVSAKTLIAVGQYNGICAKAIGDQGAVNIQVEDTLYIKGSDSAIDTYDGGKVLVQKKDGAEYRAVETTGVEIAPAGNGGRLETAELSISTTEKPYDGKPFDIVITATGGNETLSGMTYLCAWYDKDGNLLGSTPPVDVGNYSVTVYGYNTDYKGELKRNITISKATAAQQGYVAEVKDNITNGNNLVTLPVIPDGMSFGEPKRCKADGSEWTESDSVALTLALSGNLLSVVATGLTAEVTNYYVKVPVSGSNCNYEDYSIIVNLTNMTGKAIFDRCDGSKPVEVAIGSDSLPDTTLYSVGNTDGAWKGELGNALIYGYKFAGWYTAPNGWGKQVSTADGKKVNQDGTVSDEAATFEAGTTYYAKWVWTRSYVDYTTDPDGIVYGELKTSRTVYTTCLDFTQIGSHTSGEGYKWENNTLTLNGLHIHAIDSVCGIILPENSTIQLSTLTDDSYNRFYIEDDFGVVTGDVDAVTAQYSGYKNAENIITCGSMDGTADIFGMGNLTIRDTDTTDSDLGMSNYLSVKKGGIRAQGSLTIQNTNISSSRLRAERDITVCDSMVFATEYSKEMPADRSVVNTSGSLFVTRSYLFTDLILAAGNVSITGDDTRVYADYGLFSGGKVTISNCGFDSANALVFGRNSGTFLGISAKSIAITGSRVKSSSVLCEGSLTIANSSDVTVSGSRSSMPMILGEQSSFSNSTVCVVDLKDNMAGIYAQHDLTINSSNVTVSAADGQTPSTAILIVGQENDPGLVLNNAAVTQPAGYIVRKTALPDESGTYCWTVAKDTAEQIKVSDLAGTLTIVPVPSGGSSGGSHTSTSYTVTAAAAEHGGVSISPKSATKGRTVTLTISPDKGYELDKLTVTDQKGNVLTLTAVGNGKFTFTMPAGMVEIQAEFRPAQPETTDPQPAGPSYESFADLKADAWYQEGVSYVLEQGLMNGMGDGKFEPSGETSRAMVTTILWRLAGSPQAEKNSGFTDVAPDSWYSGAVAWGAENGIANGYGEAFDPNDSITREQLACMLYRFAQSQGKGFEGQWMMKLDYTDADGISDWAYEALCWMTMNGVINGKGNGILDPQGRATRAETAAMLLRFSESMK